MQVDVKDAQFKPITITLENKKDVEAIRSALGFYLTAIIDSRTIDEWHTIDCLRKLLG
jgi:hypothetical protein